MVEAEEEDQTKFIESQAPETDSQIQKWIESLSKSPEVLQALQNITQANQAQKGFTSPKGSTSRDEFGLRQYSYNELAEATDKFCNSKLLGKGGFGLFFKATLGGKKFAIKKLKIGWDERSQSKEESEKEIKVVSQVSHKNLVKLLGYCIEGDDILLVLEYVPKKSLRHHLHGTPKIIHRDVKADNILIDDKYEPKVADFGLDLLFPEIGSFTHIIRLNKGTEVYAETEHYPSQNVAKKSYVYSYSVAKPRIQCALRNEDYKNLVDSKLLQMDYNKKEMAAMISYNPESSGSYNIEPNGSQKLKPHVSSKANESHNFEPKEAHTVESNGSLEPKPLVSSEVNGSHNVEPNGSQKPKPLISSEVNESHNVEPNGSQKPKPLVNLEAYNGIEQRQFTYRELAIATNGSSDTTNGTERFQDHQQRKINFQEDYQPRRFTYQELTMATGGFYEDNRLDEGALGQVYKGDLNGEKVAVKKFNNPKKQEEEYTKMKAIASGYHHKDLVNLIGCCEEGANRLLVYEFVPQCKSSRHYFDELKRLGKDGCWCIFHGACIRSAEALKIFTRDIYQCIGRTHFFLDDHCELKIAEYGREKFSSHFKVTRNSARCMASEYTSTLEFTEKITIYSYGVMLLEMIIREKHFDDIVQWGVPQLKRALSNRNFDFLDKRLKKHSKIEINRMIACALVCFHDNPQNRLKMRQIVEVVKGKLDLQDLYKGEQQLTKQVELTFGLESLPKSKIMAS
ncbi:receptor like protein kinase S.2-like [Hevea brasiliensis]|uniref:receptor like protein kinase S.2-like n=1 Tax=Hevea brasiliensis TaxID=3981 RepID=UPI0025EAF64D|nr:receptor like protein kinase S.2-like [Hevea brasiliensis]